jgi:hypothetical protein
MRGGKNLSCARTKKFFENILKNKKLVNFNNPNFFAIFLASFIFHEHPVNHCVRQFCQE